MMLIHDASICHEKELVKSNGCRLGFEEPYGVYEIEKNRGEQTRNQAILTSSPRCDAQSRLNGQIYHAELEQNQMYRSYLGPFKSRHWDPAVYEVSSKAWVIVPNMNRSLIG